MSASSCRPRMPDGDAELSSIVLFTVTGVLDVGALIERTSRPVANELELSEAQVPAAGGEDAGIGRADGLLDRDLGGAADVRRRVPQRPVRDESERSDVERGAGPKTFFRVPSER
jgi:hypothetical protein